MSGTKVLGIVLLALGVLAILYGGFSYSRETADARIGPVEIELREKKRVNVPLWAGVVVAAAGGVLLVRKG
jgi:hypothetical protein